MKTVSNHRTLFLVFMLGLFAAFNCTSPTEFEDNAVRVKLNVLYPGQKGGVFGLSSAIDRVTVSVFGFRGFDGSEQFPIIEDQELAINTAENVAEGEIVVPLGNGREVTGQIDGQTFTGENIRITIEMFEGGSVVFTGDSGIFFVAPGVDIDSPTISLATTITDPDGNSIGSVAVSPNPSVAYGVFTMDVTIAPEFASEVASVAVTFLIPNGNTLALNNLGGGRFSLDILGNFIGRINFEFVARNIEQVEVGRGTNFVQTIVDPNATGYGREITLRGDFDIAIGRSLGTTTIVWTQGEAEGEIGANLLRVEDITNGAEVLWEIRSAAGAGPFTPVVIYGNVFSGITQVFPENNAAPSAFINGRRYRITIEGEQGAQPRSAFTEFTFDSSTSEPFAKSSAVAK